MTRLFQVLFMTFDQRGCKSLVLYSGFRGPLLTHLSRPWFRGNMMPKWSRSQLPKNVTLKAFTRVSLKSLEI